MRLLLLLALASFASAQADGVDNTPATHVPAPGEDTAASGTDAAGVSSPTEPDSSGDAGTETFTAPPTQDTTGPWNITYFIVPTRNNYWVNDAVNSAKWTPVNVPTNIMLSNSNSSVYTGRVVLAQNQPGGTGTWTGMITGYPPGNNYMLQLTAAGNPDQKFAQSQGFWIKPNGTAMPQQVSGLPASASSAPVAPGTPGTPGGTTVNGDAGGTGGVAAASEPNAGVPNVASASTSTSATKSAGLGVAVVFLALSFTLLA